MFLLLNFIYFIFYLLKLSTESEEATNDLVENGFFCIEAVSMF